MRQPDRDRHDSAQDADSTESDPAGARIQTFEEFWPYYVGEHADPTTRTLHFAGTTAAALCLAAAIATRRPALLLGGLVAGYGPAWFSHFFIEKNRPATFTYPSWSLLADLKMWSMIAQGTMDAEVERVLRERESRGGSAAAGASASGSKTGDGAEPASASRPSSVLN